MSSQDLVNAVNYHLSQGESHEEIKELLLSAGWQEQAVDEVFENLPKPLSFWQQLPIYPYFKELDDRTAELPASVVLGVSGILIVLVIVIAVILNFSINPFDKLGEVRDRERDLVYSQLQTALGRFYEINRRYPSSLSELVPAYIYYVPRDPVSKKFYDYVVAEDGSKYSFCILFETKSPSSGCVDPEIIYIKPGQVNPSP